MMSVKLPESFTGYLDKRRRGVIGLPNWVYAVKRRFGDVYNLFRTAYRRVRYHWFTPYRVITIRSIKANEYRDVDTLMFETIMQLLINFVESEKAHMTRICTVEQYKDYLKGEVKWDELDEFTKRSCIAEYAKASWFDKWWHKDEWNEILGVNYLEWEIALQENGEYEGHPVSHMGQSSSAAEILRIYNWYKHERPRRIDPWDGEFEKPKYTYKHEDGSLTNEMLEPNADERGMFRMREMTDEYAGYLKECSDLEAAQIKEDTLNAMKIVEIRGHLWT